MCLFFIENVQISVIFFWYQFLVRFLDLLVVFFNSHFRRNVGLVDPYIGFQEFDINSYLVFFEWGNCSILCFFFIFNLFYFRLSFLSDPLSFFIKASPVNLEGFPGDFSLLPVDYWVVFM
jgi:hypothetical protein